MAKVELKYNPYTKKVEKCTSDGKPLDMQSAWGTEDMELGEWADSFIEKIDEHFNDSVYEIVFEGIERDADFLKDAATRYGEENKNVKIIVKGISKTTPSQKLTELKGLFCKIQEDSPFKELKTPELKELFDKAVSSEFELAVVATMSSGKSTLINAMLGRDLLPARNKATTANLVRIHDIDGQENFKAIACNKDCKEIETIENATQKDMDSLNNRGNDSNAEDFVSRIEIYGDIKGIDSTNMKLVLTDTPGPNNSQNQEHKEYTYSLFKNEFKPMILYVLNASQLGTDDDDSLLRYVADAMAQVGRQSQDRFIFALNKADEFDPEKGEDIKLVMDRVKKYLEDRKVHNPKIFPCDARSAKVFRQYLNEQPMTETEENDILPKHKSIVKRKWRHFSDLAPLSPFNLNTLNKMLEDAKMEGDEKGSIKQALIYTGIPAIELAISEYLSKYALPAKLTKGVDSFMQKIKNLGLEAHANKELSESKVAVEKTKASLAKIEELVSSGRMGKEMADDLKDLNLEAKIEEKFNDVRTIFMNTFRNKTERVSQDNIDAPLAEKYAVQLNNTLKDLQVEFKTEIASAIQEGVGSIAKEWVARLNKTIKGLVGHEDDFSLSSAGAILGDAATVTVDQTLSAYEFEEDVVVGSHWEKNTKKKWYKPWTWFQEKGWEVNDYKTVKKVNFSDFLDKKVQPEVENFISDARELTKGYAKEEQDRLRAFFEKQIAKIEESIKQKAIEKQQMLSDQKKFEALVAQNQKNLEWLNAFQCDLDKILVI